MDLTKKQRPNSKRRKRMRELPKAKAIGRPSTFKPEYCQMLKQHFAEGRSFETFAYVIGVGRMTLYRWEETEPKFRYIKENFQNWALYWWEEQGRKAVQGLVEKFNASAYIFTMKNRFGWRDGFDVNVNVDISGALSAARERAELAKGTEVGNALLMPGCVAELTDSDAPHGSESELRNDSGIPPANEEHFETD